MTVLRHLCECEIKNDKKKKQFSQIHGLAKECYICKKNYENTQAQ